MAVNSLTPTPSSADAPAKQQRVVSWWSHGIASAVATKLALAEGPVTILCCSIKEEHSDNARFRRDCERWYGQEIILVGNDAYNRSTDRVFRDTRYLVGPKGARCTAELKKVPRWVHGRPDDRVVMGFDATEQVRVDRLKRSEPMLDLWPILLERGVSKAECREILADAGIELPMMYRLGYINNNCIGCVKGGMGYWNKIRADFPERFAEMAAVERELGRTVLSKRWHENGKPMRKRLYLDELSPVDGDYKSEPSISCGILCQTAEKAAK